MVAGWLFLPALAIYWVVSAMLSWLGWQILSLIKLSGIPIFKALKGHEQERSVSLSVAEDYARSKQDSDLKGRIEEYSKISKDRLQNEVLAACNFMLVIAVAWISCATGAPNFLMKISSFADSFLNGLAYPVCLALLIIQGCIGRAANFHLLRASGNLPPSFFYNDEERERVEAWVEQMVAKHEPLARQWMKGGPLS